LIVGISLEKS